MDHSSLSHEELVQHVTKLEAELKAQNEKLASLLPRFTDAAKAKAVAPPTAPPPRKPRKEKATFDPSKYNTRHIALKFAYLGGRYNGFEHHVGNTTPLPTIEEELWKALVKTRLIFPPSQYANGANGGEHEGIVGDWEGCDYSKCGRTDRGVSAFGQVIGIRVRSSRPKARVEMNNAMEERRTGLESGTVEDAPSGKQWDPIKDELPYIALINRVLPQDIRILAWCPNPPSNFDARFSCKERMYRYFFTSPAFLPLPGDAGISARMGGQREGWLDIEAMQEGARYLLGTHDFRNLCKVDASKQLTNFSRRISDAKIVKLCDMPSPAFLSHLSGNTPGRMQGVSLYCFQVRGSAFLWHQVRCMVAVLFLIGQRLESPSLIKELLDVGSNPRKPHYEMASDAPLVLWDCMFSIDPAKGKFAEGEKPQGFVDRGIGEDELEWVYAGDAEPAKWGPMGMMPDLWKGWRKAKMDEILAEQLLDLVAAQGKETDLPSEPSRPIGKENQRVFEGYDDAFPRGEYVPVMRRPRMDLVEEINARWLVKKGRAPRFDGSSNAAIE